MIYLPPKPSLEAFIQTCMPLAILPSLEAEIEQRVEMIAQALTGYQFQAEASPIENLVTLLKADQSFLGVLLALTNLSQEKFLRILTAERFAQGDFGVEWNIDKVHSKLQNQNGFAEHIAELFIEGRNHPTLSQHVARFYLDQITLFDPWDAFLGDSEVVRKTIRRKLTGEYTDKKGDEIERQVRLVLDQVETTYGVTHGKG